MPHRQGHSGRLAYRPGSVHAAARGGPSPLTVSCDRALSRTDIARTRAWVGVVVDVRTFVTSHPDHRARPWLGLRRRPGRLALAVFRVPLPLYRAGWGWLLGRTFLLLVHAGRKTGQPHAMTAMVLHYDAATREAVICSGWGPETDWIRNIRARPALEVQLGRESFTPLQRFLSEEESFAVTVEFCLRHPARLRVMRLVLGWDLRTEAAVRGFVQTHPFVAFRPDTTR
jgi:deazaflavin-dependent oxidoreductase (nitroreductase family)